MRVCCFLCAFHWYLFEFKELESNWILWCCVSFLNSWLSGTEFREPSEKRRLAFKDRTNKKTNKKRAYKTQAHTQLSGICSLKCTLFLSVSHFVAWPPFLLSQFSLYFSLRVWNEHQYQCMHINTKFMLYISVCCVYEPWATHRSRYMFIFINSFLVRIQKRAHAFQVCKNP